MSFLDSFFKKKPVIEADDAIFGHIVYEQGIWAPLPAPPSDGFMITEAPESGPNQLQRDFFQKIDSELSDFEERARTFISSRIDGVIDGARLSVYSVEIGSDIDCALERFVLEMCFEDANIIHRVSFAGKEPVEYGFDC
jgi:hypothetical protein